MGENIFDAKDSSLVMNSSSKTWRTLVLLGFTVFFILFFVSKAFVLQIIKKDASSQLSDQNRIRQLLLEPERGVIYDRNGDFIVRNKPAFSLDLSTVLCSIGTGDNSLCVSMILDLAKVIPLDTQRITSEILARKPNIILVSGLSKEQLLPLETNLSKYPGVSVVTSPQRDYLYADAFAHLIGYVGIGGKDYPTIEGKMGVEQMYDNYISGSFGSRVVQVDAMGDPLSTLSEKDPTAGHNVTLYADSALQKKAFDLLKQVVETKKAVAGTVVAQDPKTGGILALVSYPAFDPNKMSGGISSTDFNILVSNTSYPFFNRAIAAAYPPGSTFKMVAASAALAEKTIGEYQQINDPGYIQIGTYRFNNWKLDGSGLVDMRRALQVSNDTYFYTIGGGYGDVKGLGIEKLSKWAKRFGFGSKTGIDLPGEVSGFMPDGTARDWYLGDTYITTIGQGDVLATPLQVNNYVSYFANGGHLMQPRVVKSIDGVETFKPEVITQNLTDSHTLDVVREGMKMAVELGGTAYPLFDFSTRHPGVELAGKTGTSEYKDAQGKPGTHAWLSVFGPFDNATISLTVFLEGGGGGSDNAAPIAKELLDLWFKDIHK
jgi:penicillin-binding protein 2